jgi:hypothetical protein
MKKLFLIALLAGCNVQEITQGSTTAPKIQSDTKLEQITLEAGTPLATIGACDTLGLNESPRSLTFTEDGALWALDYKIGVGSWGPAEERVWVSQPECAEVRFNDGCAGYKYVRTTVKVTFQSGEPISAQVIQYTLKSRVFGIKSEFGYEAECSITYTK